MRDEKNTLELNRGFSCLQAKVDQAVATNSIVRPTLPL